MLIKNSKSIADLTAKVEENTNNITFNNTIAMENRKGIVDNKKSYQREQKKPLMT